MSERVAGSRYATRRVGGLILVALLVFVAAVLQAGVLREMFEERLALRVILPEAGLAGLNVGARVEVLGTDAGSVDELVIDPEQRFHAEIGLGRAMRPFVRRDSKVFIRKQFGIAGASYLEITRGRGEPLDWDFAVLTAEAGEAPTENVGAILKELRARIFPLVEDVRRTVQAAGGLLQGLQAQDGNLQRSLANLETITSRIAAGEGSVGRLLSDDTIARELEGTVLTVNHQLTRLDTIMAEMARMTATVGEQSGRLPAMIENANRTLASLDKVMREVARTMPALRALVSDAGTASSALPTLLMQSQETFSELERLLIQLQGLWLFGGGDARPPDQTRMSPLEARP
jgi:phospholipid/cholesterol/gamma-HCH transport system substrate-binding protein